MEFSAQDLIPKPPATGIDRAKALKSPRKAGKLPAMNEQEQQETPAADSPSETSGERDEIACVEALLFASDSPLRAAKIVQASGLSGQGEVTQAVKTLNERYEQIGSAFRIESLAGGFRMLTRPEYHDVVSRLHRVRSQARLSQAYWTAQKPERGE